MSKRPAAGNKAKPPADTSGPERAAALTRLIAYARDEALMLNAQFLVYCLDASLAAAQEELNAPAPDENVVACTHSGSDAIGLSQLH